MAEDTITTQIPEQVTESTKAYFDRLAESHERFAAGLETTRARNARIADKFFEAFLAGQKDAIELGKTVAAEPTAFGKNIEALMRSMTAAQERSLEVAKTIYREQSESVQEARDSMQTAFESTKDMAGPLLEPLQKMSETWTAQSK